MKNPNAQAMAFLRHKKTPVDPKFMREIAKKRWEKKKLSTSNL